MSKYAAKKYNTKERFINYWHQIDEVLSFDPESALEIGVGSHIVNDFLKKLVKDVRSMDIDKDTNPDILGSVAEIPLPNNSVDVVLAAEILEHIPFEQISKALSEMARVARKGAVISVPHNGATFSLSFKIPLIKWVHAVFKIPYFWKTKGTTDEHFWEVGLKGYPLSRVKNEMRNAGFSIVKTFVPHDDAYRMFFVLKKK